jgi:hypothetical protein
MRWLIRALGIDQIAEILRYLEFFLCMFPGSVPIRPRCPTSASEKV